MKNTTRYLAFAAAFSLVLALSGGTAQALTCQGKTCDWTCGEGAPGLNNCGNPSTFTGCDSQPPVGSGNGDGFCVICGQTAGGRNLIFGTSAGDIICGNGGDDEIHGNGGADSIDAGADDDAVDGDDGNDTILGNSGDDAIDGGLGDDFVDGGGGNDDVTDASGSNLLYGGSGDDEINTLPGTDAAAVFGSILCGDGGKDTLKAGDYGNQCMDPGSGQGSTVFLDCQYTTPGAVDPHDAGATTGNCKQVSPANLAVRPSCGCL